MTQRRPPRHEPRGPLLCPTRSPLAVALQYEKQDRGAPRVVASGGGAVGENIIEAARRHGVPIERNPGLAAALAHVEIGEEIPLDLYKAVSEVLIFILRMSGRLR
jgi:flagellar biosynthesis protein